MSANIPANTSQFAVARSDFIDAHNSADLSVRRRLVQLKAATQSLLGANIEALAKVSANPQYAKQEKSRVDGLLDELRQLQIVRCDLVHSRMEILSVDGVPHAFFSNIQKATKHGRTGLLLSLNQLAECSESLNRIAREIDCQLGSTG